MMDDLISRQAAIDVCMKYNGQGYVWACIMGDIRKLPSAQPDTPMRGSKVAETAGNITDRTTGDCISRQAAIDDIETVNPSMPLNVNWVKNWVKTLPPAQPERTQFDCDMAYMQGKTDGIRECTEQLRKLKIKMEVKHETD